MIGESCPSTLILALRTSKRPSPSSVWYSYFERMVPCTFTGDGCSASCAMPLIEARQSASVDMNVAFVCFIVFYLF